MTHVIEFSIPATDVISANGREHHMRIAGKAKRIRETAQIHSHNAKLGQRIVGHLAQQVRLEVAIGWQPLKRRRDAHNLGPTIKHAIDGALVDAGLIPDDSDAHLLAVTYTTYDRHEAGVIWLRMEVDPV